METKIENKFNIQRLYLKSTDFVMFNAPENFKTKGNLAYQVELKIEPKKLEEENLHDVSLQLKITGKIEEKDIFMVTVNQAGVFELAGFTKEQLDRLQKGYCPGILYPYARQSVSNIVTQAGLAPINLTPINFEALYLQQKEQKGQKEQKEKAHHEITTH